MKKISTIILSFLFLFAFANTIQAQADYKLNFNVNAGVSMVGNLINVSNIDSDVNYSASALPAGQLTADFYVTNWLSMGIAGSYQFMSIDYTDYGANNADFSTKIHRTNMAFRPLVHYLNRGRINLYSGLRLGFTNWKIDASEAVADYDYEEYVSFTGGMVFAPQLVAFGIRGYFTENLGANLEFAIGAPHYMSGGISFRF